MAEQNVSIPKPVLDSVETPDELQDWLTANNPKVLAELREARREDLAGEFKPWRPARRATLAREFAASRRDYRRGKVRRGGRADLMAELRRT
jgi:hypothetical protein